MLRWLSSRTRRANSCRLLASCLSVLTWSASAASQLEAPKASGKKLPEYSRLRLEMPNWSLDHAVSRQPPVLELSLDQLGVSEFTAAILAILDPDDADSQRSHAALWGDLPARLDAVSEFRAEKPLGRIGPLGAFALHERLSRAEACLEVVGWCDLDGGWRSAVDLRLDVGDVMPVPTSYVMRLEWLSIRRNSGGSVSSSRFFQGLRGEF
jgi:hypothetical protein